MRRQRYSSEEHEEHADETWLVPYSDILTLLLALFIVLFASSQIDQKKFEQVSQSFNSAFQGGPSIFENMRTVPQSVDSMPLPMPVDKSAVFSAMGNERAANFQQETAQLLAAKRKLDKYIEDNNLTGAFGTLLTDDGLLVRIKEAALFESGRAELVPASREYAAAIAAMLTVLPQKVIVSGHTDNIPINTADFPTNWDLSSKRALNFMKYLLVLEPKLQPARFSAIGHGEYRPATDNKTPEGRAQNRRVEVLIVRSHSR